MQVQWEALRSPSREKAACTLLSASDPAPCMVCCPPGQQAEERDGSPPARAAVQRAWLSDPEEVSAPCVAEHGGCSPPRLPSCPLCLSLLQSFSSLLKMWLSHHSSSIPPAFPEDTATQEWGLERGKGSHFRPQNSHCSVDS